MGWAGACWGAARSTCRWCHDTFFSEETDSRAVVDDEAPSKKKKATKEARGEERKCSRGEASPPQRSR